MPEMRIHGGSTSGLSAELKDISQRVIVSKEELEKTKETFKDAEVVSPRSLTRLVNAFDAFDEDNDGLLNLEELEDYTKSSKIDAITSPLGLFGDDKGLREDQIDVLRDVAEDKGLETKNLDMLIESFIEYDTDKNGRMSNDELRSFAKENEIELPKIDELDPSKQFIMTAVGRYLGATETTLGVIGGALLETV